jgi:hypothetical protein
MNRSERSSIHGDLETSELLFANSVDPPVRRRGSAGRTLPRRLSTLASRRASPGGRWCGFRVLHQEWRRSSADQYACSSHSRRQPLPLDLVPVTNRASRGTGSAYDPISAVHIRR